MLAERQMGMTAGYCRQPACTDAERYWVYELVFRLRNVGTNTESGQCFIQKLHVKEPTFLVLQGKHAGYIAVDRAIRKHSGWIDAFWPESVVDERTNLSLLRPLKPGGQQMRRDEARILTASARNAELFELCGGYMQHHPQSWYLRTIMKGIEMLGFEFDRLQMIRNSQNHFLH